MHPTTSDYMAVAINTHVFFTNVVSEPNAFEEIPFALRQASLTLFRRGKASLLSLIGASEAREVGVPAKEHQQKACRGKKLRPTQENKRFDRWLLQIQA